MDNMYELEPPVSNIQDLLMHLSKDNDVLRRRLAAQEQEMYCQKDLLRELDRLEVIVAEQRDALITQRTQYEKYFGDVAERVVAALTVERRLRDDNSRLTADLTEAREDVSRFRRALASRDTKGSQGPIPCHHLLLDADASLCSFSDELIQQQSSSDSSTVAVPGRPDLGWRPDSYEPSWRPGQADSIDHRLLEQRLMPPPQQPPTHYVRTARRTKTARFSECTSRASSVSELAVPDVTASGGGELQVSVKCLTPQRTPISPVLSTCDCTTYSNAPCVCSPPQQNFSQPTPASAAPSYPPLRKQISDARLSSCNTTVWSTDPTLLHVDSSPLQQQPHTLLLENSPFQPLPEETDADLTLAESPPRESPASPVAAAVVDCMEDLFQTHSLRRSRSENDIPQETATTSLRGPSYGSYTGLATAAEQPPELVCYSSSSTTVSRPSPPDRIDSLRYDAACAEVVYYCHESEISLRDQLYASDVISDWQPTTLSPIDETASFSSLNSSYSEELARLATVPAGSRHPVLLPACGSSRLRDGTTPLRQQSAMLGTRGVAPLVRLKTSSL